MLLGAFPFEHSTSAADEQRAFNEVHFEQIRIHWTENERNKEIVKRMSPECMDLLDRIFKIAEKDRITVAEIKQHAWYTETMSEKYEKALKEIDAAQAALAGENSLARVRAPFTTCLVISMLALHTSLVQNCNCFFVSCPSCGPRQWTPRTLCVKVINSGIASLNATNARRLVPWWSPCRS
jgi:serine/threonine protein kinase